MTQIAPPTGDSSWIVRLMETAGAAIMGALVTLVAFRTKLAIMGRDIDANKAESKRQHDELKAELRRQREDTERRHTENLAIWEKHMATVDRRQAMMLEIVAGIARKVGADARFSDSLVRYLTEEDNNERS